MALLTRQKPTASHVSFDEIVQAHCEVGRTLGSPESYDRAASKLKELWDSFGDQDNAQLLSSYFGDFGKTGVALTETDHFTRRAFVLVRYEKRPTLHVVVDLATAGEAGELVSRYERLRVKADQLLAGAERKHVMRVVYDRLCRVMRIVDQVLQLHQFKVERHLTSIAQVLVLEGPAGPPDADSRARAAARRTEIDDAKKRIAEALVVANTEAVQAEDLCNRAIRRRAMMAYFVGMLLGVAVFSGLAVGAAIGLSGASIPGFDAEHFLTVFIAGAVGAIVSVMSRRSSGDSWLDYETAPSYLRLLGMFRPLIGAIFGVALYFGIQSGVLQFIKPPGREGQIFFFFAFIAFLAGFSERWASDILVPIKQSERQAAHGSALNPDGRRPASG
jgi:hypothetical protein